jgi:hypothetical protein
MVYVVDFVHFLFSENYAQRESITEVKIIKISSMVLVEYCWKP